MTATHSRARCATRARLGFRLPSLCECTFQPAPSRRAQHGGPAWQFSAATVRIVRSRRWRSRSNGPNRPAKGPANRTASPRAGLAARPSAFERFMATQTTPRRCSIRATLSRCSPCARLGHPVGLPARPLIRLNPLPVALCKERTRIREEIGTPPLRCTAPLWTSRQRGWLAFPLISNSFRALNGSQLTKELRRRWRFGATACGLKEMMRYMTPKSSRRRTLRPSNFLLKCFYATSLSFQEKFKPFEVKRQTPLTVRLLQIRQRILNRPVEALLSAGLVFGEGFIGHGRFRWR